MRDTPRTDTVLVAWDLTPEPKVLIEHARQLERELNAANSIIRQQQLLDEENLGLRQRIKRLEEAGDAMEDLLGYGVTMLDEKRKALERWRAAKEAKP
jgi:hypothetical protein